MAALRKTDLARVFARSLWLQASWSFEGMQTLGFAYAIAPALLRLGGAEGVREGLGERHLEFFNTHPFLASGILGVAVRLEEDGEAEGARRIKGMLMGPFGALGDSLYWGALKPFLMLGAVLLALRGVPWAPWAFLGFFGAANLTGRAVLFGAGYRHGLGLLEWLERVDVLGWAKRLKALCALLLGAVVAQAAAGAAWGGVPALWSAVPAAAAVGGLAWAVRRGLRPVWAVYLTAAVAAACHLVGR